MKEIIFFYSDSVLQPQSLELGCTRQLDVGLVPSSAVLMHGHAGQLRGDPMTLGAHVNLCMLFIACFLMFKH